MNIIDEIEIQIQNCYHLNILPRVIILSTNDCDILIHNFNELSNFKISSNDNNIYYRGIKIIRALNVEPGVVEIY